MLGSLARKLRALGFDTFYYRTGDDSGLLRLCEGEGRILLTSDRSLSRRARAKKVPVILLEGGGDSKRIAALGREAGRQGIRLNRGEPLCSLCGAPLQPLKRADVASSVPHTVLTRHRLFFRCERCGQLYWRGSHWKKLRSMARRLDQSIHAAKPG
jgi:uncharacterized protein